MIIQFDARLIEDAVRAAVPDEAAGQFHEEREAIYAVSDEEDRDRGFATLSRRWFEHLGLDQPVRAAIQVRPRIGAGVGRCVVGSARRKRDEGAELYVRPASQAKSEHERRRLVIQLTLDTLIDGAALESLLTWEMLHVADMLDPAFGYEPRLPQSLAGPTHDRLLLDRYSVLWHVSVAGRLVGERRLPASARVEALARFSGTFPMLDDRLDPVFARFFEGPRPPHDELVAFARDPRGATGLQRSDSPGTRCALCDMPTYAHERVTDSQIAAEIERDFPRWQRARGICPQCVDLYRARTRTRPAV